MRVTIGRVKQVSKYLEVWTPGAGSDERWQFAFRNGWLERVLWDDEHYDEILTYGMSGLVIELGDVNKWPRRILGRQSTYDRIPGSPERPFEVPRANAVVFPEADEECIDVRIWDTSNIWIRSPMSENLLAATKAQREDYCFVSDGTGISWSEIDEDLSVKGLVRDAIRWWKAEAVSRAEPD